jgi:hypothetical protein
MEILNYKTSYQKILIGGFFILTFFSCNTKNKNLEYNSLIIDSVFSKLNSEKLLNYDWSAGFHMLKMGEQKYLVSQKNDNEFIIHNLLLGIEKAIIKTDSPIHGFSVGDSSIYYLPNNSNQIVKIFFSDTLFKKNKITYFTYKSFFGDSFFVASNFASSVRYNYNTLAIPYGNKTLNESYLDTFGILLLTIKGEKIELKKIAKVEPNPNLGFEYLIKSITSFNSKTDDIIYTYQKSNKLYKYNLDNNKLDSITIDDYSFQAFDSKKKSNMTYLRKYVLNNDKNSKIICDDSSNIYLIRRNASSNINKFTFYYFDKTLKLLGKENVNTILFPEISFIYNNKLYVSNKTNGFSIFTFRQL